jgi:hypothetical protein
MQGILRSDLSRYRGWIDGIGDRLGKNHGSIHLKENQKHEIFHIFLLS